MHLTFIFFMIRFCDVTKKERKKIRNIIGIFKIISDSCMIVIFFIEDLIHLKLR